MATNNVSASEEECTCPVCCDIFTDPVVLLCGHSFCKDCLQEWWRQTTVNKCPVCKEIFPMSQPPRNLALRNLSDNLKRDKSQRQSVKPAAEELCSEHGEKLKLFCEDDQQLICVICRDAKKHKQHNCSPINEAAEAQRNKLKLHLMNLKTKLYSFKKEKVTCDQMSNHITNQAQQTEKTITEEFQKLYQFLRAEETARIDALRKETKRKSEAMNIRKINLNAEMSSLTNKIETIEKEMKSADVTFLLNINSTKKTAKCDLPEPETPSGALIDEAKHVGNLQFTVWNKMKDIIKYTPVTLDPNTGDPLMKISEGMTRSTRSDRSQVLPENPERLSNADVFGSGGFTSGKHTWDVEVEGFWKVGVTVPQKEKYGESDVWGIYVCTCHVWLHEITPESDSEVVTKDKHLFPIKVRVHLDCDQGIISFFDLDKKTHVHTVKHKFTEKVYPYFSDNVKILPAALSVNICRPSQIFCTRSNNMRP